VVKLNADNQNLQSKKTNRKSAITLIFIATLFGELFSAHQTPQEFFNPLTFILMALPYGFGALLFRELTIRWKKGKICLFILSIVYGIYEEAIVVRSIFDTNWHELEAVGQNIAAYNWLGVNWTYGVMLLHFHITVSIMSSVIFTEIKFDEIRRQQWVSTPYLILCAIGLLLWIPVGYFLLKPDFYPWNKIVIAVGVIILLIIIANKVPRNILHDKSKHPRMEEIDDKTKFGSYFSLGLLNTAIVFFIIVLTADTGQPSLPIVLLLLCSIEFISFLIFLKISQYGVSWKNPQQFATIMGIMGFYITFCFLKGFTEEILFLPVGIGAVIWFRHEWNTIKKKNIRKYKDSSKPKLLVW